MSNAAGSLVQRHHPGRKPRPWRNYFLIKSQITALHWMLAPEPPTVEQLLPTVEDVLLSQGYMEADNKQTWLRRALLISPQKISQVVEKTVGQRSNPLWGVVRKHRITASNFGAVLGAIERDRYPASLQKRLLSSYNLETVRSVAWGISQEPVAINKYCQFGAVVEETGIWMHESGVLGASPDGIVRVPPQNDANLNLNFQTPAAVHLSPDIIEVKCPYSARDMTVKDAMVTVKDFCLVHGPDGVRLKEKHPYYHQIQGQLHISKKMCCDLIVMTLVDVMVVRIDKDMSWLPSISKLIQFYYNKFIPALVG